MRRRTATEEPTDAAASGRLRASGPGSDCPLCGFPTFDWFDFNGGTEIDPIRAIERRHPDWTPTSGACRQCAELYASRPTARARSEIIDNFGPE